MPELELHQRPRSEPRKPAPWRDYRRDVRRRWSVPIHGVDWCLRQVAWALSQWSLLHVLEHLGTFSILIAAIFYFYEAPERRQIKQYQAWQVINTAQGKGGSGGRIEALRELNEDRVPLTGVDVSGAFLQGVDLERASLVRANFSSADLRDANLSRSNLEDADLTSANARGASLSGADLAGADLSTSDLTGANLARANLRGANLRGATLEGVDLQDVVFDQTTNFEQANLQNVRNAPPALLASARRAGALID